MLLLFFALRLDGGEMRGEKIGRVVGVVRKEVLKVFIVARVRSRWIDRVIKSEMKQPSF
jgi:hypothetical protein